IRQYEQDGIFFPVSVLSAEEVSRFRSAFEAMEARLADRSKPIYRPHLHYRWAYDLATHPVALDAVEDIIGPDILVHSTIIFYKRPQDPGYVAWHQDGYYPTLDLPQLISAWIALSDSTIENGCMRVIPGSHRQKLVHVEKCASGNLLWKGQEIAAG